jgi:hypothetical protein
VPDKTTDRIMSGVIAFERFAFEGFTFEFIAFEAIALDAIAFDVMPKNETCAGIRFVS